MVINTLAARIGYGKALLDAVAAKKLPASRHARPSGPPAPQPPRTPDLDKRIAEVWGIVRATPADRPG